jgi:hypothetical protein
MARYAHLARLPVGQHSDPNQATNRDVQTKNRKCKPQKRNDKISSKSQKKTTGGARTQSNRSARDSVQAHGLTHDISKSVPRKDVTMADGSIDDHSSKFSKESSSSSSSSLSSSSSNNLGSNDESNLSSSLSQDLSSDDKHNQDEKSDNNASSEVCATNSVDGLEMNCERFNDENIEILPLDKNASQIVQLGHPLAKKTSSLTQFETFFFSKFDLPRCLYLFPMTWPCIS